MKKCIYVLIAILLTVKVDAQLDTVANDSVKIKVHFLYGSKPKKKYKETEKPWFGGIHGGHVSIEAGGNVVGFEPFGSLHIVSKSKLHSEFVSEPLQEWVQDTATLKYTTIVIPISKTQYDSLLKIHAAYTTSPPYDYAFLGMRCASATYEILGRIGVVDYKPNTKNVAVNFYPKKLRQKLLKLAECKGYEVIRQEGRTTRIWEED